MQTMTKAELVEAVARATGETLAKTDRVITESLAQITIAMGEGHNVQFRGFGTFEVRQRKERTLRNPSNGDPVVAPAHCAPVFKAGKHLKDAVRRVDEC